MNVYVVMSHNKSNYLNENTIQSIHLTEDLADKAVQSWEESQANYSRKNEFWVEDYELDVGNFIVQENTKSIIIYSK